MKKCFMVLFSLCCFGLNQAQEIDVTRLEKIGPVTGFIKTERGITLNCGDNSQVQVTVLAPDLIRIRASFAKPVPSKDHSWAIAKDDWQIPLWTISETKNAITIATSEIEAVIERSPLLIDFRDAHTHQTINADEQPMTYDAKAVLAPIMFDPSAGQFVAAAKKLGFDEHFYGLGEKAAPLDKRRGFFVNWNSDTPGYTVGRDPIYQTIPFYLGLQKGAAYGIFFDNSYRSYFDFGRLSQERTWFGAEGGELNYYFFYGPSIKKIVSRYADLTGHMPLVPLWALGVQQCRYSYYPESVVEEVVRQYREHDLPLDEELVLEDERVEADVDAALDRVLDGHEPDVGVARLGRRQHLRDRAVGHELLACEVGLREQRLFGERARRAQEGDACHGKAD